MRLALDNNCGLLTGAFAQANQRAAKNSRVLIENGLAGHAEKGANPGFNSMGLASAEPKSIHVVDVTDVSHAVPDRVVIIHLGQGGGAILTKIFLVYFQKLKRLYFEEVFLDLVLLAK